MDFFYRNVLYLQQTEVDEESATRQFGITTRPDVYILKSSDNYPFPIIKLNFLYINNWELLSEVNEIKKYVKMDLAIQKNELVEENLKKFQDLQNIDKFRSLSFDSPIIFKKNSDPPKDGIPP